MVEARDDRPTHGGVLVPFWQAAGVPDARMPYVEFQARRYPSIARFLRRHGPWESRTVLDLGGGVGSLAVQLKAELGGSYHVADFFPPSPALRQALAERGISECFQSDLTEGDPLEAAPTPYDAILFVEVLEHLLVNPVLLFRRLAGHLAPDGMLFLTTPNQARLSNRWKLLWGRSIKDEGRYPTDEAGVYGHVIEYTVSELDVVMHYAGFAPVEFRVVQQVPRIDPTRTQRAGVSVLNSGWASRAQLGDDILALYRKLPGPPPSPSDGGRV
ncbi:MAG: class I SAM-dependent methyltransferase [Thermoplasmata archaeon]|nr:class I SAM-dependent methyltransferase [Thermoplasmata archaeon]